MVENKSVWRWPWLPTCYVLITQNTPLVIRQFSQTELSDTSCSLPDERYWCSTKTDAEMMRLGESTSVDDTPVTHVGVCETSVVCGRSGYQSDRGMWSGCQATLGYVVSSHSGSALAPSPRRSLYKASPDPNLWPLKVRLPSICAHLYSSDHLRSNPDEPTPFRI